ncbi:MAG: LLM class flavin-dependent oxidoreductase [Hyphomicrobiaceae bacterium]
MARGVDGDLFAGLAFDYLFSVANLDVLPQAVIARAGKMAFNFHDGPLPGMAGLNAPVWALLAGAEQHAVTWHEMTEQLDAGRIAVTETIDIGEDETAFSLNAKCYEAGLAAFERLCDLLMADRLELSPQVGSRGYFARSNRPRLAGLIDPTRTSGEIVRLVRSLDHGPYWNPLALPKLATQAGVFAVSSANRGSISGSGVAPGTIIARDEASLTIATGGNDAVRLAGLHKLDGRSVSPADVAALTPGAKLADLTDAAIGEDLDRSIAKAARDEAFWIAQFSDITEPAELGYPTGAATTHEERATGWYRFELATQAEACAAALGCDNDSALLTGLATWLTRTASGDVVVAHDATVARDGGGHDAYAALYHAWRPLRLAINTQWSPIDAARSIGRAADEISRREPIARDLEARLKGADAPATWPAPLVKVLLRAEPCDALIEPVDTAGAGIVVRHEPTSGAITLLADSGRYSRATAEIMARHLTHALDAVMRAPDQPIEALSLVPLDEAKLFAQIDAATEMPVDLTLIDEQIARQVRKTPDRVAVRWHTRQLTYGELDAAVDRLAAYLSGRGAAPGKRIAISLERTPAMIVSIIAVLRTGAAYVPIDPRFPLDRIDFIRTDCDCDLLITDQPHLTSSNTIALDTMGNLTADARDSARDVTSASKRQPADFAYLTYTSGSTGKPKGVCVTHANVANFFAGMDQRVPYKDGSTWLAVTSISFDISVLELLWTLSRGFTVALHSPVPGDASRSSDRGASSLGFSLFFFAAADDPQVAAKAAGGQADYRLLMDGARFADANGFEAVWTPERHFHGFGGIYPNPAVTGAAVAAITRNVAIRAGSCVLPLHDPLRVAEDWALVDNISGGRAGVAFASGWMPSDFVLAPDAFAQRKAVMLEHMDTIEQLWRGETIERRRPDGSSTQIGTLPRPVQRRLPMWLTAAKNPETFELAGQRGCNILTHMLGMSIDELEGNIARYRTAWQQAGHAGEGRVTVMLHTFVGQNDAVVRETVRAPMKRYLASAVDIVRAAAWSFPTVVRKDGDVLDESRARLDADALTPDELDAVLEHAFDRYYRTSGLFDTPERCVEMAETLRAMGVNELACLIDFGVDTSGVLANLPLLAEVMRSVNGKATQEAPLASVGADIRQHAVSHLQCTPSLTAMLLADEEGLRALRGLDALLVGGEALPRDMATRLAQTVPGKVLNMYGPTETTVWSTTADIARIDGFVPLGTPIANTRLDVVDSAGRSQPALIAGELLIGGSGVSDGYWRRPELTAERFVVREQEDGAHRFYRTGDLVRRHGDGALEFLGRIDHQVKIRGHRIELGEIEATLATAPGVAGSVVVAHGEGAEASLSAYVVAKPDAKLQVAELRHHVSSRLPAIMVPARIAVVDAFPLTPNGKIDRKALANRSASPSARTASATSAPTPQRPSADPTATASGVDGSSTSSRAAAPMERIGAVWSRLLDLDAVAPDQNFFDLGGHSLLAVEMHRILTREMGLSLKLTDIFRFPTIAALSRHLADEEAPPATSTTEQRPESAGAARARMRLALTRRGRATPGDERGALEKADGGQHE